MDLPQKEIVVVEQGRVAGDFWRKMIENFEIKFSSKNYKNSNHFVKSIISKYLILVALNILGISINAQNIQLKNLLKKQNKVHVDFLSGKTTPQKALNSFLEIQQKIKPFSIEHYIDLYLYTSLCYDYASNPKSEIKEYRKGILLAKTLKSTAKDTLLFKLYADLALTFKQANEIVSAQIYYEKCFQLYKQNKNIENKLPIYVLYFFNNYGVIFQRNEDYRTSNSYLLNAIELGKRKKIDDANDFIYGNLAQNSIELGDYANAEIYLRQALKYIKRDEYKADKYLKLSDLFLKEKQPAKAWENIKLAKNFFEKSAFFRAGAKMPWFELKYNIYAGNQNGNTCNNSCWIFYIVSRL